MAGTRWQGWFLPFALLIVLGAAVTLSGAARPVLENLLSLALSAAAGAGCARAALRSAGGSRSGWWLIAFGCWSWAAGQAAWTRRAALMAIFMVAALALVAPPASAGGFIDVPRPLFFSNGQLLFLSGNGGTGHLSAFMPAPARNQILDTDNHLKAFSFHKTGRGQLDGKVSAIVAYGFDRGNDQGIYP